MNNVDGAIQGTAKVLVLGITAVVRIIEDECEKIRHFDHKLGTLLVKGNADCYLQTPLTIQML